MTAAILLGLVSAQCTFSTEWLPREQELLALDDGTVFAFVEPPASEAHRGPMTSVTVEPDGGVEVLLKARGLEVHGHSPSLTVTMREPPTWGEGFVAAESTRLAIVGLDGGSVALVPARRTDFTVLQAWTPTWVDCAKLRLGRARSPTGSQGRPLAEAVRVSTRRGAAPVFELPKGTLVEVGARKGVETQLRAQLQEGAVISGWTTGAVGTAPGQLRSFGSAGIVDRIAEAKPRDCDLELPLFVKRGERVERVGRMQSGVFFDVLSSERASVEVRPRR